MSRKRLISIGFEAEIHVHPAGHTGNGALIGVLPHPKSKGIAGGVLIFCQPELIVHKIGEMIITQGDVQIKIDPGAITGLFDGLAEALGAGCTFRGADGVSAWEKK